MRRLHRPLTGAAAAMLLGASLSLSQAPNPRLPDALTVEGWKRQGFVPCFMGESRLELRSEPSANWVNNPLASFQGGQNTIVRLRNAPPVPVPFGIDLGGTEFSDRDVKSLAAFKTLTGLTLSGTKVTDAQPGFLPERF
jgi:hypothetical protein